MAVFLYAGWFDAYALSVYIQHKLNVLCNGIGHCSIVKIKMCIMKLRLMLNVSCCYAKTIETGLWIYLGIH